MVMCEGDVVQYKALKCSTMAEYLTKLDTFVSRIEAQENKGNILKHPGLKPGAKF